MYDKTRFTTSAPVKPNPKTFSREPLREDSTYNPQMSFFTSISKKKKQAFIDENDEKFNLDYKKWQEVCNKISNDNSNAAALYSEECQKWEKEKREFLRNKEEFNKGIDELFVSYREGIMCDRVKLAVIAREEAEKPYNGKLNHYAPNIQDIVALFPKWSVDEANGLWCAAFVYHCAILAGFKIPVRPKESSCSLAGCVAWEEWAQADSRIECHSGNDNDFQPAAGDIVLFDRVFNNTDHDHIGIVLENYDDYIITAEGNVENVSRILERKKNSHIRAYIRIPDNFSY